MSTKKIGKSAKEQVLRAERKKIPTIVRTQVLTEAGYRCAVPRCRAILALQLHHIHQVAYGGEDTPENLVALCPTCHSLYHLGTISVESIYAWKAMLVAISRAFDLEAVDKLLFLDQLPRDFVVVSGDGVLRFARLIAAGLATVDVHADNNGLLVTYRLNLSAKGTMLVAAWREGNRGQLRNAVAGPVPGVDTVTGEVPRGS